MRWLKLVLVFCIILIVNSGADIAFGFTIQPLV